MQVLCRFTLAAALCLLGMAAADAQTAPYPNRPIRLLVGYPPGGAVDLIARLYGQGLSVRLGQPVVIENKPGSGSNLAADIAAHSTPDGYTLFHGPDNVFMSNPHIYGKMPFDVFKDFMPIDARYRATGRTHAGLIMVSTKTFPQNRTYIVAVTTALNSLLASASDGLEGRIIFLRRE